MANNQPHQMMLGLFVLLLVDIIWVASSELSEYIFKDIGYDKPFFSTYTKTSLFSIYLLGFLVWPPWRHQCCNAAGTRYARLGRDGSNSNSSCKGNHEAGGLAGDIDQVAGSEDEGENTRLSSPQFEPVKMADTEKSSDGEGDDSTSSKSVRFNRVAEVRQMPESDGVEALISRLSFSASLRAQQELYNLQAALPVRRVASLALAFCILWFMGNYSYQMALSLSHSGIINVVSSTSGLFTLILAGLFPSGPTDSFTLSKLVTVLAMLAGVVMVSMEDMHQHQQQTLFHASSDISPIAVHQQLLQQPLYHHSHHHALPLAPVEKERTSTNVNNHNVFLPVSTMASGISSSKANVRVHRDIYSAGVLPGDRRTPIDDVFRIDKGDQFNSVDDGRGSNLDTHIVDKGKRVLQDVTSFMRMNTGHERQRRSSVDDDSEYGGTGSVKFYDGAPSYPDIEGGGGLANKYDQTLDGGTDDKFITSYDSEDEVGRLGDKGSVASEVKNKTGATSNGGGMFDADIGGEDTGRLYPNSDPASDHGHKSDNGDHVTSYSGVGDVGSTVAGMTDEKLSKDIYKKKMAEGGLEVDANPISSSRKKSGVVTNEGRLDSKSEGRRHQNVRDETFSAAAANDGTNATTSSITAYNAGFRGTGDKRGNDSHSNGNEGTTLTTNESVGNSTHPTAVVTKANGSDDASGTTPQPGSEVVRSGASAGVSWALCGAVLYACYMVFLRRRVGEHQHIDIPMFFGFVGVFNAALLWPGLVLLHASGWEVFTLPTARQMIYITANGLVGTVLSELLWLWGCFLTSSLVATLSLSLTIPLSMVTDVLLRGVRYSWLFYAGSVPIVGAFVVVTALTHYNNWDPLGDMCCPGRSTGGHHYSTVSGDLESESLIVSQGEEGDDGEDDEDEHFSASSVLEHPSSVATTIANTVANTSVAPVDDQDVAGRASTDTVGNVGSVDVKTARNYSVEKSSEEVKQGEQNEGKEGNKASKEVEAHTKDLIDMEGEALGLKKKRACDKAFKDEALQALIGAESGGQLLLHQGQQTLVQHHQHPGQTLVQHHQSSGQNDVNNVNKFLPHVGGGRKGVGETFMNIPVSSDGKRGNQYAPVTTLYGGGDNSSGWLLETSLNRLNTSQTGINAGNNCNISGGGSSLSLTGSEMKITNNNSSKDSGGGEGRGRSSSELFQLQQLQSSPGGSKTLQRDAASSLKHNKNEYNASTKQQTFATTGVGGGATDGGGSGMTGEATTNDNANSIGTNNSHLEGLRPSSMDTTSASSGNKRFQHQHHQSILMDGVADTSQSSYASNHSSSGYADDELAISGDFSFSSSVPNSSFSSGSSQIASVIDTNRVINNQTTSISLANNLDYQSDNNNLPHNNNDNSSSSSSNNSSSSIHQSNQHNPTARRSAKDTWRTDANSSYYSHGFGNTASAGAVSSLRDARYRQMEGGGRGDRLHLSSRDVHEDEEDETLEIIRHEDNEIITSQFIATNQV